MENVLRKRAGAKTEPMMEKPADDTSFMSDLIKLGVSASAGIAFGVCTEKGKVFEPQVIQDQMLLKRFIMLKMFLSALVSGMFVMSLLSMLPFTRKKFLNIQQAFGSSLRNKGVLIVFTGGLILGVGMTLSGACPGMVLSQVGAGTSNAGYTLLGCFGGALLYGVVEPLITQLLSSSHQLRHQFLDHASGSPYFVTVMPIAVTLAAIVFGLEIYFPWRMELVDHQIESDDSTSNLFAYKNWPPFVCGAMIGMLQLPMIFFVRSTLGASSSFCTLISQLQVTENLQKMSPYLGKYRSGIGHWSKVFYVGSAIVGSYLSTQASGSYGVVTGVSPARAFLGGLMIVFGARMAGGCTSGHGLSGFGLLFILSIYATVAIFVGGIATAFMMKLMGAL
ncbi:hypothetical protein CHS0354_033079 [Potamilus streckersoni]|uniref:Sulphur transport domain-containing protein n=1 Tax=Potamilus streckersoni TaxID=2493646 RepID=A0AAE0RYY6_9BIVA|nr:hypothetical protein CHS0354_033079 [Potamilus streckersoni]